MDIETILEKGFATKRAVHLENRVPTPEEEKLIYRHDNILDHRTHIIRSIEDKTILHSNKILREVDHPKNWQPSDYLPDFSESNWIGDIINIQKKSVAIPLELMVVLVGDTITEEALPAYLTLLNRFDATRDMTGSDQGPWQKWAKWWTAEENRHGTLLYSRMRFDPRLHMQGIEDTIQHLISNGFDPGVGLDPYKVLIYTSFQEKATLISHRNTAILAKKHGDKSLYDIAEIIAIDEARHYNFYMNMSKEIFQVDPNQMMTAYAYMMKRQIDMPAKEMADPKHPDLFNDFAQVAQHLRVYTSHDYKNILIELNQKFDIENTHVYSDEAKRAKEYVLKLPKILDRVNQRIEKVDYKFYPEKFPWIKS